MQPRAVELMQHVAKEVLSVRGQISGGVFLTGGGALIRGLAEVAEQVFDAPTRVGFLDPSNFGGLIDEIRGPQWACAAGLAVASMRMQMRDGYGTGRSAGTSGCRWIGGIREKFK